MRKQNGKTIFTCEECGNTSYKWEGRCPSCGKWNSIIETTAEKINVISRSKLSISSLTLSEIEIKSIPRLDMGSDEINRVLGGGIVPGSLILIAGEPGIGKSTLMLKLAAEVADKKSKSLYVSGEESPSQIKMHADRLGLSGLDIILLATTDLDEVVGHLELDRPALAVIDSIQTMQDKSSPSEAGSVFQIKECTRKLMAWSKHRNIPIVIAGHVTKGGDIAGPRVLEHIVDVVLYMEGDSVGSWRLLRTTKNRFGPTNEVGVLEMTETGLSDVEDPSATFLSGRTDRAIGSVVVSTMEGSRPLLVEIQALTSPASLRTPRRVATGINTNRLLVICAVLARRLRVPVANQDVVVNVPGGLKINEPAADLGVALAIVSSLQDRPIDSGFAAIGEIGLSGEIRDVPQKERRLREISRLGIQHCLVPSNQYEMVNTGNVEAISVDNLAKALEVVSGDEKRIRKA